MASNIFLTSSVHAVINHIGKKLDAHNKHQKVLFIKTAAEIEEQAGEDMRWMEDDKNALIKAGFLVTEYTITGKSSSEIKQSLDNVDIIYIEGGDPAYLLYQLQHTGADELIKDQVSHGKIYIGTSAGSVIAGPELNKVYSIETPDWANKLKDAKCLNFIDVVILSHWGSDYFKKIWLDERMSYFYNINHKIIPLRDNQYIEILEEGYKIVDVNDEDN